MTKEYTTLYKILGEEEFNKFVKELIEQGSYVDTAKSLKNLVIPVGLSAKELQEKLDTIKNDLKQEQ